MRENAYHNRSSYHDLFQKIAVFHRLGRLQLHVINLDLERNDQKVCDDANLAVTGYDALALFSDFPSLFTVPITRQL